VAAGLLVRPTRLIGVLGSGVVLGILAGLIVSVNVGLFGFNESLSAPFAVESVALETAAAVTLAAWIAMDVMEESRQAERGVS
jgi:cytochrome bd-type quinol oxidase subunit 2